MARGSISVVLVRPLVAALQPSQQALSRFFSATDLTPEIVADADARISPAQFCVAWAEATRLSGDPTLSLRIAEATPQGAFGVVEYVCRSAPTLRDALVQWVRYLGILDDAVDVALVELPKERGKSALRVTRESEAPAPASHELCFALVVRHARTLVGAAFAVSEVRFVHRATDAQAERHRAFYGARAVFGAKQTELVLDDATLDRPLSTADPHLLAILLPTAEQQRRDRPAPAAFADQVRVALRSALANDDAQLDAVARKLAMTGRSLQRRLRDEGISFQAMRDEVRRELADRYLSQGLSFAEISFMLGFSEPSAFFRAFKRWTGQTPFERRVALVSAPT